MHKFGVRENGMKKTDARKSGYFYQQAIPFRGQQLSERFVGEVFRIGHVAISL